VYFNGGASGQLQMPCLFGFYGPTNTDDGWEICYNHSWPQTLNGANYNSDLAIIFSTTGANEVIPLLPWVPVANTWYHLAVTRQGSTLRYFVNGTMTKSFDMGTLPNYGNPTGLNWPSSGTIGGTDAIHTSMGPLSIATGIGSDGNPNPQTYFNGYMDELRITKGTARYTATFTVPTGAFPDK
jgi:hypothetical protein